MNPERCLCPSPRFRRYGGWGGLCCLSRSTCLGLAWACDGLCAGCRGRWWRGLRGVGQVQPPGPHGPGQRSRSPAEPPRKLEVQEVGGFACRQDLVPLAPPLRRWQQPTAGLGIGTAVRGLWLSGLWCPGHGNKVYSVSSVRFPSLSPSFSQRHQDPADWGGEGGPGSLGVQCSCAVKPQHGRHALRLGCPRWPGWIEASVDPKCYSRE